MAFTWTKYLMVLLLDDEVDSNKSLIDCYSSYCTRRNSSLYTGQLPKSLLKAESMTLRLTGESRHLLLLLPVFLFFCGFSLLFFFFFFGAGGRGAAGAGGVGGGVGIKNRVWGISWGLDMNEILWTILLQKLEMHLYLKRVKCSS